MRIKIICSGLQHTVQGDYLDHVAVTEAKAKRKAKKLAGIANARLKDDKEQ